MWTADTLEFFSFSCVQRYGYIYTFSHVYRKVILTLKSRSNVYYYILKNEFLKDVNYVFFFYLFATFIFDKSKEMHLLKQKRSFELIRVYQNTQNTWPDFFTEKTWSNFWALLRIGNGKKILHVYIFSFSKKLHSREYFLYSAFGLPWKNENLRRRIDFRKLIHWTLKLRYYVTTRIFSYTNNKELFQHPFIITNKVYRKITIIPKKKIQSLFSANLLQTFLLQYNITLTPTMIDNHYIPLLNIHQE